jgi:hypothetical protein
MAIRRFSEVKIAVTLNPVTPVAVTVPTGATDLADQGRVGSRSVSCAFASIGTTSNTTAKVKIE